MRTRAQSGAFFFLAAGAIATAAVFSACSSSSAKNATSNDAAPQSDATASADAGTCGAFEGDGGGPNIATPATGCSQDLACPAKQFCYAPQKKCVSPATVNDSPGTGQGGHAAGGAACVATLALPCDNAGLAFSPSIDVSKEVDSLVESDTVVAADGKGTVVLAWSKIPDPSGSVSQLNRLAVSHDDGATFTLIDAPTDAATSAANDSVLQYDAPSSTWIYVWEGYETNFSGAQHIFVSTSKDAATWSPAVQADTNGDFQAGGALDFPWLSVSPIDHRMFITYQVAGATTVSEHLVVGDQSGFLASSQFNASTGAYPDLLRNAFDTAGNFYGAWLDGADTATEIGGTISGGATNHIFFNRIDVGADAGVTTEDGGLQTSPRATLAKDVQIDATPDVIAFEAPAIAVAPDGSHIYVAYVSGTKNAVNVIVRTSSDRGATWSSSVVVNDDGTCATHFHPSLVLDANNNPIVFWYDNRDGAGHFFYSTSTDDGQTWKANRLVSAPSFPFDTFQYSTGWLGDYYEPSVANGELYVLWSDGREGDQSHAFFSKAKL